MIEFYFKYKFIIVPTLVWFGIQMFKVLYKYNKTKRWDWRRLLGAGGMPSSHSAIVTCVAAMIGKYLGVESPIFALGLVLSLVVMYDAAGVRRTVGKQSKVLNEIIKDQKKTNAEKLQEMTGHTPFQVIVGALIGLLAGLIG